MLDWLFSHAIEKLQIAKSAPVARCKVCNSDAEPFDVVDFNKSCHADLYPLGIIGIPVVYLQCKECQFIFTEFFDDFTSEQWKRYVYNDEYIKVDPEYAAIRPRYHSREVISLLTGKKLSTVGLDYGGGNGTTAELLRQAGWKFDSFDPFGHIEMSADRVGHYNFCSALEVFEHTTDPRESLRDILERASPDRLIIMIRTGTHDGFVSKETRLSWWYAAPRNGHVSIYSKKSLQILGASAGLDFRTVRGNTFLFTRGHSRFSSIVMLMRGKALRRLRHAWSGD